MLRTIRERTHLLTAGVTLVVGITSAAPMVSAHDFWIEPETFRPQAGQPLPVTLRVGEDFVGTSQPLIPAWFSDYSIYASTQRSRVEGLIGDDPAGTFTPTVEGTQVIGYRSTRSFVEIEAAKFTSYLEDEGLEWAIAARERLGAGETSGREWFSRCAKALILPSGAKPGSGHDQELGYTLELIPQRDPYALRPGARLPVNLIYESEPLAGALVVAFTAEDPASKFSVRTDKNGAALIPIETAGTWLVKAVHIIALEDNPGADWESFWASLTFNIETDKAT